MRVISPGFRAGVLLLAAAFGLSACAVTSIGTSRSLARAVDDSAAGNAVKARMLRSEGDFSRVDVDVNDGVVLLTGRVLAASDRIEAERIAWSAPKVNAVANELRVDAGESGRATGARDQWLSAQVRARLTTSRAVTGRNINVETYDGVVYLLGRVDDDVEARRAAESASRVPGVTRVISYLRGRDDVAPTLRGLAGEPPAPPPLTQGADVAPPPADEPALAGAPF